MALCWVKPEREKSVNFNSWQWLGVFLLDLFGRPLVMFLFSFNIVVVLITPYLSFQHLFCLVFFYWAAASLLPEKAVGITTLVLTNIAFYLWFAFTAITLRLSQRATICSGLECDWVNGVLT